MYKKCKALLISALAIAITGCSSDSDEPGVEPIFKERNIQFIHNELENVTVYQFHKANTDLRAATSGGIYKLEGDDWVSETTEEWHVFDVTSVSPTHILASVCYDETGEDSDECSSGRGTFSILESKDGGESWALLENDFGKDATEINVLEDTVLSNEKIHRIDFDHVTQTLYATGFSVLAKSEDFGVSWTKLMGDWQGFARGLSALTVSPDRNTIWVGGQGAIEDSVLRSFNLLTNEETEYESMTDMLSEPATVKSVVFDPTDDSIIYAAGEPGIIVYQNGDWVPFYLNEESRFYFDLLISPADSNLMITATWVKLYDDPQPFVLEITDNKGEEWAAYKSDGPGLFGGTWSMTGSFDAANNSFTGYFGLMKGGIMKVIIENLEEE